MNERSTLAEIAESEDARDELEAYGIVPERDDLESVYLARLQAARQPGLRALVRKVFTARRLWDLRAACWAAALLAEQHAAQRQRDSRQWAHNWSRRSRLAYEAYRTAATPAWVQAMFAMAGTCPLEADSRLHYDPLYLAVLHVERHWSGLTE
jgi:hypothetical protein